MYFISKTENVITANSGIISANLEMQPKFNVNDVTAMMEKRFAEFKTGLLQDLSKDIQTFVDERKDGLNNKINGFF